MRHIIVVLVLVLCAVVHSSPSPPKKRPTMQDLQNTDKDVHKKLEQLHKVIDALQETVASLKGGYDQHAKENAAIMKRKFEKLTKVVSKLGHEKNNLYVENRKLRKEKAAFVDKITSLEALLRKQAEALKNSGADVWLRKAAQDLKTFLEESGLEHFASPHFSPLIAGIVANGVVLLPLVITSLFLLRYVKQLSLLRVIMALNLFDIGFTVAMCAGCALLLGDVFEGLRHISEVNFMFIQLVLAAVFWMTCAFLLAAIVQNRKNKAWRYALLELVLRGIVAMDYMHRIWSPVMAREDVDISLPMMLYGLYLLASVASIRLTTLASTASVKAQRHAMAKESGDPEAPGLLADHNE